MFSDDNNNPSQLVANAILFVCVNCVGMFHLWTTEHDLRISNQKREQFSRIRSQKEIRKYQQVIVYLQTSLKTIRISFVHSCFTVKQEIVKRKKKIPEL